jgi:hypothetical protein
MQKYFIKATLDNGRSGYDPKFVYKEGWNEHPNPNLTSNVCGAGMHLGRTIGDAQSYVPEATEYYLAIPDKILGRNETKIRTNKVYLWRIPNEIIDDYKTKCKPLDRQTMKHIIKLYEQE